MKFQTVLLLSCLIAQATPSFAQGTKPATIQELNALRAAGVDTLAKNSHELQSKLGIYAPTDADLARFIFADAEEIRKFRENTMGLSMDKNAQYVIATVEGREVLLRSSSIQRDGVFDLKASGGLMAEDVPGNRFLKELQGARGDDTLTLRLTVRADGSFDYKVTLESMWDNVEDKVLTSQSGNLRLVDAKVDRALSNRVRDPFTIDVRDAVRKIEKR